MVEVEAILMPQSLTRERVVFALLVLTRVVPDGLDSTTKNGAIQGLCLAVMD